MAKTQSRYRIMGRTLTGSVTVTKFWFGNRYLKNLAKKADEATKGAGKMYAGALKRAMEKTVGSDPLSGNMRVRKRHSFPGQFPNWQTGNLANSIQISAASASTISGGFLGMGKSLEVKVQIYAGTDVPYARVLERGGRRKYTNDRPYTSWRLINPLKSNPYVRVRPVWRPVFDKNKQLMLDMISASLKNTKVNT